MKKTKINSIKKIKSKSKKVKQFGKGLFDIFKSKEKILTNKLRKSENKLLKYAEGKVRYAEIKKLSSSQMKKLSRLEGKYDARQSLVKALKTKLGLHHS
jgi:hypothetical protein